MYFCTQISTRAPLVIALFTRKPLQKNMDSDNNNWKLGEVAILPRTTKRLKESGTTIYEHVVASRYLCVRESTDQQHGILVKVFGKMTREHIKLVCGKPFCKDDKEDLFLGDRYFSYPFPSLKEVQDVLEIIRNNKDLVQQFETASMHINPESTFWVSETTTGHLPFAKKPQFYDARSRSLSPANDYAPHYRLSLVFFHKGELTF